MTEAAVTEEAVPSKDAKARPPKPVAASSLAAALVAAQTEMPTVKKDELNPHFNSRFVSLSGLIEATRKVLNRHGLALVQSPTVSELGQPVLRTILIHGPTGEQLVADTPLVATQNMQQYGSAITYARRYAWASMLGIASEDDDDGNTAAGAKAGKAAAKVISDAQRRRLFAVAGENSVGLERMREIIAAVTGDPNGSSKAITGDRYDEIIGLFEAEGVPF
jgi:hypothetical protein